MVITITFKNNTMTIMLRCLIYNKLLAGGRESDSEANEGKREGKWSQTPL